MLEDIDKNDVNISKLFDWSRKISIKAKNGELVDFYIKVVGEADWNKARVNALRDSSKLRKKLNNENSDEREAFIQEMESLDKDVLIEFVIMLKTREYTQEAIDNINLPFPKEPKSDAPLEKQEEYQMAIDNYSEKRMSMVKEKISEIVEREREKFSSMSFEELYNLYETLAINQICREELDQKFLSYCTFYGTYLDEDLEKRAFDTFEEFESLPRNIKTKLMNQYAELDLGSQELKK